MLDEYLEFAKNLALQAGDIMLEYFKVGVESTTKSDGSPVTLADTAINTLVIEAVAQKYPDHSVRGEEESNQKEGDESVWVCDPIDGTIPFSYGIPISTFSIALVKDGQPIVAVVYDPYTKRLYFATKSKGAYLNGKRLRVNQEKNLSKNPVYAAHGTKNVDSPSFFKTLRQEKDAKVFVLHSSVYGAMQVASGQFVAAIHSGDQPHDVVASKLIVEEAGGKVTDLRGEDQRYDQLVCGSIATNGFVHNELVELVKPYLR